MPLVHAYLRTHLPVDIEQPLSVIVRQVVEQVLKHPKGEVQFIPLRVDRDEYLTHDVVIKVSGLPSPMSHDNRESRTEEVLERLRGELEVEYPDELSLSVMITSATSSTITDGLNQFGPGKHDGILDDDTEWGNGHLPYRN